MTTSPPAGWYPAPDGGEGQRWWDGQKWTEHRQVTAARKSLDPQTSLANGGALLVILAGILAIIAAFLSWLVIRQSGLDVFTRTGFQRGNDGVWACVFGGLAILTGVCNLTGWRLPLINVAPLADTVALGWLGIAALVDVSHVEDRVKTVTGGYSGHAGPGVYLVLAAAALTLVGAVGVGGGLGGAFRQWCGNPLSLSPKSPSSFAQWARYAFDADAPRPTRGERCEHCGATERQFHTLGCPNA